MDPEDGEEGVDDLVAAPGEGDDVDDAETVTAGLGAIGQLAVAVLVVVVILVIFMGSSALLRRIFG
jgi:hypothetical protein